MKIQDRLPAGLFGKGTETFTIDNEPYTSFGGRVHSFEDTPECRIEIYKAHMKADPKGERVMEVMTNSKDDEVKVKQWMMCRFGGMDNTPDIDKNNKIQEAEYVPCPKRGSCKFEGFGCTTVETSKGAFLSRSELAVTRRIVKQDKLIAKHLYVSTETIKTHIQNIRRKTNCRTKLELVYWATVKGII